MGRKVSFTLDNRLSLCASFVREGTRLADVGTDHAYLPVKLAAEGRVSGAVACDIRKGPLENARTTITMNGVEDIVKPVLSDGLDNVSSKEADDIVIAGMGGELIARIIEKTQWLFSGDKRLILQPMTRMETLRLFLYQNGFIIEQEKACVSGRKCYSVMLCRYDGIVRECSKEIQYFGLIDGSESDEAAMYVDMIKTKLQKKINGLLRSGKKEEAEYYMDIISRKENNT